MADTKKVEFYEGELLVKTLCSNDDLRAAYRLRHKVYSGQLGWVPPSPEELEKDGYDAWATSVGLFLDSGALAGVIRLLPSSGPFMLEKEFLPCLNTGHQLRKESDTNEITRLTLDPTFNDKGLSSRMLLVLLKGLYQWLTANDIRFSYMVVEKRFLRVLRAIGFPAQPISPYIALPPAGALSVAAILDWEEFRDDNSFRRPGFFEWISTVNSRVSPERLVALWKQGASPVRGNVEVSRMRVPSDVQELVRPQLVEV